MPYHLKRPPGRLLGSYPGFHDGLLTSITVDQDLATLGLLSSSGERYKLLLQGVARLRASEFREGNIIMHLEVVQGEPAFATDVAARLNELYPPPHVDAAASYHEAHVDRLAESLRCVASGEAALVSLEASYGCDFAAICSEVYLVQET